MIGLRTPEAGDRVAGYELRRPVGAGGMGIVFEAVNGGPPVAMKILKPELAVREESVLEFREEARATAAVEHEGVVRIHECGLDRGFHYLVMEFVDGPPLEKLLVERGPLPWRVATRIAVKVAEALGAAHAQGLVHRDIKPGNILFGRDGAVRLTDFGIVKDISSLKGFLVSGRKVGTAAYASPEQCLGKRLGPATDIYSLGATLYHLVCGRPPFTGDLKTIAAKHVKLDPIAPVTMAPGVPKALSNAILKMLAKRQTDRFASMEVLAKNLKAILDGRIAVGIPDGRAGLRRGSPRRA